MALEPLTGTATQEENPELRDMTRRFWVGAVLTLPLLVVAMYEMIPGLGVHPTFVSGAATPWLEFVLANPVVLWCGLPFFQRFWTSLINRSPNMFTLIGLGTGVAYIYSVVATFLPGIFRFSPGHGRIPRMSFGCRGHHHAILLGRSWNSAPAAAPAPPSAHS
jgi:Cu+-exporting ATPase